MGFLRRRTRTSITLIEQRVGLLRLLRSVPNVNVIALACAMMITSLLPAATAVAVARLVKSVLETSVSDQRLRSIGIPLLIVGLLLAFDQIMESMLTPFRYWVGARVNGAIRQRVRRAVSIRSGIDHLEDQVVRDAASLPVENAYLFNLGAGAEGQLWLLTRFIGAAIAAGIVATYSVVAAFIALAAVIWQRSLLRRHYANAIATAMVDTSRDARAAAYWSDILGSPLGAKELRMFGFGDWALKRFLHHGRRPPEELERVLLSANRLHWQVFAINGLGNMFPFLLLARLGANGDLTTVQLTAALGGVVAINRVLGGMGFEAFSIEAAVPQLAAVDRVEHFGAAEQAASTNRRLLEDVSQVPTIVFDDLTFCYPNTQRPVLNAINLTLYAGQSVAIVGENGAGKTTLLKLLAGFYQPTSGRILIDGCELSSLDPAQWRRRLAVIFQDFTRFELSALENVAMADPRRSDALGLAELAAKAASADQIIADLPHGWDTVLSRSFTGGVELSGGEWQRIALARALYCAQIGAQVLVLDEPTASLDVGAEVALFDQLLTHAQGCTALVVSHRFSTVRRADRIIVVDNGQIVEDGSHATLKAQNGLYATLYDLQAKRFVEDAP